MGYKFQVNHEYFKSINSEYKAYILGFLYADGCVQPNRGKRQKSVRIGIQEEDEYILEKFSKEAAGGYWRKKQNPSHKKLGYKPITIVHICSDKLCDDLIKLGCNVRKSSEGMEFPNLRKDLVRHFIRGFLDGDGSVILKKLSYNYKRRTSYIIPQPHRQRYKLKIAFSSTDKNFLLRIAEELSLPKIYIKEQVRKNITYTLWIENKEDVSKVIGILYTNSNHYLARKINKVIEFNKTIKSEAIDTSIDRLETT